MKSILNILLASFFVSIALAQRPNIILVMADDMGYGDPSYVGKNVLKEDGSAHPDQGWINTPVMDEMAANGLVFNRFYSASAQCSPTRASCLTGRNPVRVGIPLANTGVMEDDESPLSKILTKKGYRSAHFGKWHLGSLTTVRKDSNRGDVGNTVDYSAPWHNHYRYHTCFVTEAKVPTYHPYRITNNAAILPTSFAANTFYGTRYWRMPLGGDSSAPEGTMVDVTEVNNATNGDDSKLITDQAITFINDSVADDKPFFIVLWYHTPHRPTVDPDGTSGIDSSDSLKDSIEDMDTAIGTLRSALTLAGVRGNTMLWLTSDNGPEDGMNSFNEVNGARSVRSGGLRARKRSLYEGGIRVPGILEWPDVISSARTTDFVSSTSDYYPTILDYLNIAVDDQLPIDGVSLRPMIEGKVTERSSPIGFIHSGDEAYVSQDYKITRPGAVWELWDMRVPDHQKETTALATEDNISSQPQAIQDIYNELVSGYNAWELTVNADTHFVDATVPVTTLTTGTTASNDPFTVNVTFDHVVTGLSSSDFKAPGALITNLTGSGGIYTLTATPDYTSDITITLPQGAAFAADGTANAVSNTLTINVSDLLPESAMDCDTKIFDGTSFNTVDSIGKSPADGSNNVFKFSVADGAPYTTSLYVRSSNLAERQVRAYLKFDLNNFSNASSIGEATLTFRGFSLNNINGVNDIQVGASSVNGLIAPNFNAPILGDYVSGGNVADNTGVGDIKEYSFDVTDIVKSWVDGSEQNNGFAITMANLLNSNGVGIDLSEGNRPTLEVCNSSHLKLLNRIDVQGPSSVTTRLIYKGGIGELYRFYGSTDLLEWILLGSEYLESPIGTFTHESTEPKQFYRIDDGSE